MVWYGMVFYGMVWYGMVWYGMVWYGMVWYGMVWYGILYLNHRNTLAPTTLSWFPWGRVCTDVKKTTTINTRLIIVSLKLYMCNKVANAIKQCSIHF